MHTIATTRMKPGARAALRAALEHHRKIQNGDGTIAEKDDASWARPRDIGGTLANRYAVHLRLLCNRGLIEKRDGAPGAWRDLPCYEYRITPAGREELEAECAS